ncbi:MAG: flavodoxin family protein [Phycisphaerae bacterium]
MAKVITIYHSGFGHTKRLAEAVQDGAQGVAGVEAHLLNAKDYDTPEKLDVFDDADAIIFGCPTYMGSVSAGMKAFIEVASKKWFTLAWKDKLAGGFTTSSSPSGDKLGCMQDLAVNAMQHGMVWVSLGMLPGNMQEGQGQKIAGPDADVLNRLGGFYGPMGQTSQVAPEDGSPSEGDMETGRRYGRRVAELAVKLQPVTSPRP